MIEQLETENGKEMAKLALRDLIETPGWKFLLEVWGENLAALRRQLEDGFDNTKEVDDQIKSRISILKEVINNPQNLINSLTEQDHVTPDSDPYEKVANVDSNM